MPAVASETHVATALIGDVVSSKRYQDRVALQNSVLAALQWVNGRVAALQPLEVTIGDEFQGAYAAVADAVRASLLLRLSLLPEVDTRFGLGLGELTVFDLNRRPLSQDGPAWWAAREAIMLVHRRQQQRGGHARSTRTWFLASSRKLDHREGPAGALSDAHLEAFVNAFLVCRDDVLHLPVPRNFELLRGWLLGKTQQELADEQGITQSAVSQRLNRLGAFALRDADRLLERSFS